MHSKKPLRILIVQRDIGRNALLSALNLAEHSSVVSATSHGHALAVLEREYVDLIAYCVEHDEAGMVALLRAVQSNEHWLATPFICYREQDGELAPHLYDSLKSVAMVMGARLWIDLRNTLPFHASDAPKPSPTGADGGEDVDAMTTRRTIHHARELIDNLRTEIHARREQIQARRSQLNADGSHAVQKELKALAGEASRLRRLSAECQAEILDRQQIVTQLRMQQRAASDDLLAAAEDARKRKEDLIRFQESLQTLQEDMLDHDERQKA